MKIYCVMSEEAIQASNGNRGKMASQAGHAFLHSYLDAQKRFPDRAEAYLDGRAKKVTVKAPKELVEKLAKDYQHRTGVALITDAGLTVFGEPTLTCVGIGPLDNDETDDILAALKVWI